MERRRVVEARDHLERAERSLAGVSSETARWAREAVRGVVELLEEMEASGARTPAPICCGICPGQGMEARLTEEIRISRVPWGEV